MPVLPGYDERLHYSHEHIWELEHDNVDNAYNCSQNLRTGHDVWSQFYDSTFHENHYKHNHCVRQQDSSDPAAVRTKYIIS